MSCAVLSVVSDNAGVAEIAQMLKRLALIYRNHCANLSLSEIVTVSTAHAFSPPPPTVIVPLRSCGTLRGKQEVCDTELLLNSTAKLGSFFFPHGQRLRDKNAK